jgi:hypothetical protein
VVCQLDRYVLHLGRLFNYRVIRHQHTEVSLLVPETTQWMVRESASR